MVDHHLNRRLKEVKNKQKVSNSPTILQFSQVREMILVKLKDLMEHQHVSEMHLMQYLAMEETEQKTLISRCWNYFDDLLAERATRTHHGHQ